jgi:hypothetical protein
MNGCHNHPPHKDELVTHSAEIVWRKGYPTVEVVTRSFKNNFDRTCQYRKTDLGKADPGCVGCKWREE